MISKVCADVFNNAQFEVQKDIQLVVFDETFLQHRDVEQLTAKNGETTMQHKHWLFNDESASLWWQSRGAFFWVFKRQELGFEVKKLGGEVKTEWDGSKYYTYFHPGSFHPLSQGLSNIEGWTLSTVLSVQQGEDVKFIYALLDQWGSIPKAREPVKLHLFKTTLVPQSVASAISVGGGRPMGMTSSSSGEHGRQVGRPLMGWYKNDQGQWEHIDRYGRVWNDTLQDTLLMSIREKGSKGGREPGRKGGREDGRLGGRKAGRKGGRDEGQGSREEGRGTTPP